MVPTHRVVFLILLLSGFILAFQPPAIAKRPAPLTANLSPQTQHIQSSDGPFDQIAQWFRDRAAEFKQTVAQWKSIDMGDAIARSIENMFSGVSNLGKSLQKQLEKSVPVQ